MGDSAWAGRAGFTRGRRWHLQHLQYAAGRAGRLALQAAPDEADAPVAGLAASGEDVLAGAALSPLFELAGLAELEEVSSDFAAGAFDALLASFDALLPPRKSVTYQPEPFNWNPAAVTCFENVSFPQAGHCVSGASLSFRSTSFSWPQSAQRYA
ncbi:hypothetical protein A9R05_01570 [Burkholderia sp. KK1]|nr:hypothetical protein A9R05_01570 [Burkholderia sp. KK1]